MPSPTKYDQETRERAARMFMIAAAIILRSRTFRPASGSVSGWTSTTTRCGVGSTVSA
jgi:hypothetical protein